MDLLEPMSVVSASAALRSNIKNKTDKVRHVEIVFSNVLNNFQRLMTAIQLFVEWGDHNFEIDGFSEMYEEQQLHIYATNEALRSNNFKNEESIALTSSSSSSESSESSDVEIETNYDYEHSRDTNQDSHDSDVQIIESPNEIKHIAKLLDSFELDESQRNVDDGITTTGQSTSPESPINQKFEPNELPHPTPFTIDLYNHQVSTQSNTIQSPKKLNTSTDENKHLATKSISIDMTINNALYQYVPRDKLSVSVNAVKKERAANEESMELTSRCLRPRGNSVLKDIKRKPIKDTVEIDSKREKVDNNSSAKLMKKEVPLDPRATWSYRKR